MQVVMGIVAIVAGVVVIVMRKRLAVRGERILRRRYGALGAEGSKHVTSFAYGAGGAVFAALGLFWIVSFLVTR